MRVLGIDPGVTGGWAYVDGEQIGGRGRMPTTQLKSKKIIDAAKLLVLMRGAGSKELDAIIIEQNSGYTGQSPSASFSFGRASGAAEAVAMILAAEKSAALVWYPPSKWKKDVGLGSSKQASLDACRFRFGAHPHWQVKANDGMAEAALLAAYHLDIVAKRA